MRFWVEASFWEVFYFLRFNVQNILTYKQVEYVGSYVDVTTKLPEGQETFFQSCAYPKYIKIFIHDNFVLTSMQMVGHSVTRLGDLLDFGQVFKAFGTN